MLIPLRGLDTAFKQQRLKAWQPILTPKSVLPTLLIVGLIFAPIGGVLIWGSNQVCRDEQLLALVGWVESLASCVARELDIVTGAWLRRRSRLQC